MGKIVPAGRVCSLLSDICWYRFVNAMLGCGVRPAPKGKDSAACREEWFRQALRGIATTVPKLSSIAFPYQIGCGLARGNWNAYKKMIQDFANGVNARVVIYKLS